MSELLDRLRAKYPQYDDIPDAELAFRVTEKYPEYKDTDLLKDAMPARAEAFGEVRAAPSRPRMLGEETAAHARNLFGPFREEETVLGDVARRAGAAGGLLGMPFRAAGQAAGAGYEQVVPYLPGMADPKEQERQVRAMEGSVEWAPQIASGVTGVTRLGSKLFTKSLPDVATEAGKAAPAVTKPRVKMPPERARTGLRQDLAPFNEETAYPAQPEYPPVQPTPFDAPLPPDLGEAGRVTAGQLYTLGRAGLGGVLGQEAGDTAVDKIRYGAVGATLGALANPHLVRPALQAMRTPTGQIGPAAVARAAAKWKTKVAGGNLFTPQDIARGLPHAENMVADAFGADDVTNMLRKQYADPLDAAYKQVRYNPQSVVRINQALDGANVTLSPVEQGVFAEVQRIYRLMATNSGTPVAGKFTDTFKHLRKGQPFQYGLYDVMNDVSAVAKKISTDGGFMPDGTIVSGFGKRGLNAIAQMKKEKYPEEVIAYYQQYLHDLTKGPKESRLNLLTPQQAARIKNVEFMRTIGLNVGSALSNMLQQLNTFSQVSPGSFIKAYYDIIRHPKIVDLARHEGVASEVLAKADIDAFASPTKFDAMLKQGSKKTGFLFGKVEELNRLHAFAAGLRDAEKAGLSGRDAIQHAKRVVDKTQFRFGAENAPPILRGGNTAMSVLGQFKSYQLQQALFLKNLVLHDPKGLAKYLGAVTALAGPDAITGHHVGDFLRQNFARVLGGDPKDYKFRGVLGEIGIALGQQVGLGALPVENLQSLAFLIPGPALSHIVDTMSLVTNRDLSPGAATRGKWGTQLTPDQWASLATRFGSVELDKIRNAVRIWRSDKNVRESRNLSEAVGLAPATGPAIRPTVPGESVKVALGVRSPETEEYGQARQEVGAKAARWKELVEKKAEAMAAGDAEEVLRLNALGMREFGRLPVVRGSGAAAARKRGQTPALERQLKSTPKSIRQQLRKEAQD